MKAEPREAPSTDETKDLQLEIVRDVGGRPLFLTARRFIRICHWIEQGESASEAYRLKVVTYQGFRQHVKRNPKYHGSSAGLMVASSYPCSRAKASKPSFECTIAGSRRQRKLGKS